MVLFQRCQYAHQMLVPLTMCREMGLLQVH